LEAHPSNAFLLWTKIKQVPTFKLCVWLLGFCSAAAKVLAVRVLLCCC